MYPDPHKTNIVIAQDADNHRWLYFSDPVKILSTSEVGQVSQVLADVESECQTRGMHAAGFLGYEAARAFDSAYAVKSKVDFPLLWFGIYENYKVIDFPDVERAGSGQRTSLDWTLLLDEDEYQDSVGRVKSYIRDGDSYQVNYSFRLIADYQNQGWPLFVNMVHAQNLVQRGGFSVFVETPEWAVCSASPELFFHYDDGNLKSMPMKGTASRGLGYEDDIAAGEALRRSEKNRAENIMIADMVRNDMGRIAKTGSVSTTDVLKIAKYPTFWTMTTTVTCKIDTGLVPIFEALFPAASITGAPKIRAMQIIDELEPRPRKIYTGSAGFIHPDGSAQFNVAIRTVLIDKQKKRAEFGVGGGIVWDSETRDEFQECHTKARVLTYLAPVFNLLETIKWTPYDGYQFFEEHMRRLENSAHYFSWNIRLDNIRLALEKKVDDFGNTPQRVRLQVSINGTVTIESTDFVDLPKSYQICVAEKPVSSRNYFLYHKTTNRTIYDNAMQVAIETGCDDVLLWNERGEVTESCRANILIESEGRYFTPPISCGLLNGIGRQALLNDGMIEEKVVTLDMLAQADKIWLVNSVRERWQVTLEDSDKLLSLGSE